MIRELALYLQAVNYVKCELYTAQQRAMDDVRHDADAGTLTSRRFDLARVNVFTRLIRFLEELEADTMADAGEGRKE